MAIVRAKKGSIPWLSCLSAEPVAVEFSLGRLQLGCLVLYEQAKALSGTLALDLEIWQRKMLLYTVRNECGGIPLCRPLMAFTVAAPQPFRTGLGLHSFYPTMLHVSWDKHHLINLYVILHPIQPALFRLCPQRLFCSMQAQLS